MDVIASKIERLEECFPSPAINYQLIELDSDELRENKAFTVKKEEEVLNIVSEEVLNTLDDTCLKEDLGINASLNYKKLLAVYSLVDYLNILRGEIDFCDKEDDETYDELILRKKEEFKINCIRKVFICEYDLADVYEQIYAQIGIPELGATAPGIGQMTINDDSCNIYTIYKTK